jgi:hypothetical protein
MFPYLALCIWKIRGFFMVNKQKSKEQRTKSKVRIGFTRKFVLLCSLLIANCSFELHAQAEPRFVHRLAWTGDINALRYEVVIEKEEYGGFRELYREFTDMSFIEVSLSPGRYRFGVTPYDYLNRVAQVSGWMNFEVRQALVPELNDALPVYFYIDEDAVHTLNISGRNLDPGGEIELRRPGVSIVPYNKSVLPDGSGAWLYFNNDQLISGNYEIHVRNPGGYETRGRTVIVVRLLPAPGNMRPTADYFIGIEQLRAQRNIVFSWSAVQGANAYIFTLYEQTAAGRREIISRPLENRTTWTLEDIGILEPGAFVWQVEAINRGASGAIDLRGRAGEHTFILNVPRPGPVRVQEPGVVYGN